MSSVPINAIAALTKNIAERSVDTRSAYLTHIKNARPKQQARHNLSCSNLAHALAGMPKQDKELLLSDVRPNLGIITAYNDMLSAHQPYEKYPPLLRSMAIELGGTAQVAGSVPAMCDGVTQGQAGMELSLFSRDVIAMAAAVGLSHDAYDGVIYLGICDKIVPGLLIAAASFGHLPAIFIPSGPMPSGISNKQKAQIRQAYAKGEATKEELMQGEMQSYHSPGTCTFYGTANTNQMLLELLGLMIPGASFANPSSDMRHRLTQTAMVRAVANARDSISFADVVTEKSLVNAMVCLLASGGSTNSAMHLMVVAAAAGIQVTWEDYAELSCLVPLLARVYPNGEADVNQFDAEGGVNTLVHELLTAGLLHEQVTTVAGKGLSAYAQRPFFNQQKDKLVWKTPNPSNDNIIRPASNPFSERGGLEVLNGNLGQAIIKTSAVESQYHNISAPALVFDSQEDFIAAFHKGKCNRDHIAVVRFQGPKANGMPELHKLMPLLGGLQDSGYKVALVTDGRLSGASGKVAAAIHLAPEAAEGGLLSKLQHGDLLHLDARNGKIEVENAETISRREAANMPANHQRGCGRELFDLFRKHSSSAKQGASIFADFGLAQK